MNIINVDSIKMILLLLVLIVVVFIVDILIMPWVRLQGGGRGTIGARHLTDHRHRKR